MTIIDDAVLARGRARRAWQSQPAELARLVRRRAGLTQGEIAALLGDVDRSAVSRWESGERTPRPDVMARYLSLLDRLTREGRDGEIATSAR